MLSLCLFWVNQRCEHFLLQIAKPSRLPGRAGSSCQPAAGSDGGVTPSTGPWPARSLPRSCRQRAPGAWPRAAQAAAVASETPVVGSEPRDLHRRRQPRGSVGESKTRRLEAHVHFVRPHRLCSLVVRAEQNSQVFFPPLPVRALAVPRAGGAGLSLCQTRHLSQNTSKAFYFILFYGTTSLGAACHVWSRLCNP